MMLTWAPLLALCVVTAHCHVSFHDWQCGSEETSRRYAYDTVYEKCPSLAAELNHCCVVHDECYVRQLGQEICDRDFCICNDRALNKSEPIGAECRLFTNTVCALMPFMGMFAYDNSINYTEPYDLPKHVPQKVELQEPFMEMYHSCPKVNSTTSSCAVMWNNCLDEFCGAQLCGCVQDAYRMDGEPQCLTAVQRICAIANEQNEYYWLTQTVSNPFVMSIFFVACFFFLMVVYYFYRKESDEATLIKYTTVIEV